MNHRSVRIICALLLSAPALFAARLPRVVLPQHYALTVTPDLEGERFRGEETISVTVQRPTDTIVLNAAEITFRSASVTAGGKTQNAAVTTEEAEERATLKVAEALPIGPASIRIEYDGTLNRQLRGFYSGVTNGRKYLASQMEATDARRAFPSFDEPDMKATFQITVVANQNDTVISNSRIESESAGPVAGKKTVRFATTPRLSTYHIALVVGDFQCLRDSVDGIPLGVCGWSDRYQLGQMSMNATKDLLRFFNSYYSIPYPFEKLDQIALSDFAAGAMENPGAITYRERGLLADPKTSSDETRRGSVGTIAHEIAHMWFGDLVTMRWWDDIWLNEGFASWMARKAYAKTYPSQVASTYLISNLDRPLAIDVLSTTRAIHKSAETPEEIDQLFDGIAYSKTAALLTMIEAYVGEEKFRDGINLYLSRNAWSNASGSDFAAAMNDATGRDVAEVLSSYISQPGVPLVRVKSRCEGNQTVVDLQQERFLLRSPESAGTQIWTIPVCLSGGDCVLLRERQQTFRLDGCRMQLFANRDGVGYYFTTHENAAPAAQLNASERMVMLRDSWYLVRGGRKTIGDHLELAGSMSGDPELLGNVLGHVRTAERFIVNDGQRAAIQSWVRRTAQPAARRLGWQPAAKESVEDRSLRGDVLETLAEAGADAQVRREARQLAMKLLSNPAAAHPSMAQKALEIAAIDGDEKLYDAYLRVYRTTTDPAMRSRVLAAIPRFRDPALIGRTLQLALTDDIRTQDLAGLLAGVLANRNGAEPAWQFINENWPAISKKLPPGHAGRIIGALSFAGCDPKWREEVTRFTKENNIREARQAAAQTAERISACAELRDAQRENLAAWLRTASP